MNNEKILSEMEHIFAALADKTRLRLLNLMRENEVCVCFFVEVLGESQPKISRHLAYLRNAGVVEARREGKWIYYSIIEPENQKTAQILHDALNWLKSKEEMQIEYEALVEVCDLSTAPKSAIFPRKPETFVQTNIDSRKLKEKEELETFLL